MDGYEYIATIKTVCTVECPIKSAKHLVENYFGWSHRMDDTCQKTLFHWLGQKDKSLPSTYPNMLVSPVKNNFIKIDEGQIPYYYAS